VIFSDVALSRRLEKAEAQSCKSFVEARARVSPESGATWIEVGGTYAMFDGISSPVTQTFGLGLFQTNSVAEIETMEAFFKERGAPVCHEVSPLGDLTLPRLLTSRGYHPFEFSSVMFKPIIDGANIEAPVNDKIRVRIVEEDEHDVWAKTAARGWSEHNEFADSIEELMKVGANRRNAPAFLAELEGKPIAAGILAMHDGVALMAGASTIPEGRKQGAQLALLDSRLRHAAKQGCDLAMMCAQPGSASQRNAERHGFSIAYTRIKWRLL
jgi:hypothetical protein